MSSNNFQPNFPDLGIGTQGNNFSIGNANPIAGDAFPSIDFGQIRLPEAYQPMQQTDPFAPSLFSGNNGFSGGNNQFLTGGSNGGSGFMQGLVDKIPGSAAGWGAGAQIGGQVLSFMNNSRTQDRNDQIFKDSIARYDRQYKDEKASYDKREGRLDRIRGNYNNG